MRNCTTVKIPYNLTLDEIRKDADPILYVFSSDITVVRDEALGTSALYINLTRKPEIGLEGNLERQGCFLYPAVVNYSLSLDVDGALRF